MLSPSLSSWAKRLVSYFLWLTDDARYEPNSVEDSDFFSIWFHLLNRLPAPLTSFKIQGNRTFMDAPLSVPSSQLRLVPKHGEGLFPLQSPGPPTPGEPQCYQCDFEMSPQSHVWTRVLQLVLKLGKVVEFWGGGRALLQKVGLVPLPVHSASWLWVYCDQLPHLAAMMNCIPKICKLKEPLSLKMVMLSIMTSQQQEK